MKNTARFLRALAIALMCITAVGQSVPELINYQGQLLDATGAPLPTGDYDIEISLFAVESGGVPIWGPQRFNGQSGNGLAPKVSVVQGRFNLILGPKDTAGNNLGPVFAANASVFLDIKVGAGNSIAPRQQMLTAPYALQARTAAGLKGAQILADGALGVGGLPVAGVALDVKGAVVFKSSGSGGAISFGSPSTETGLTFGIINRADIRYDDNTLKILNASGRLPRGVEQGLAIATSGNVGLGTLTPGAKLHVIGNIVATGSITPNSDVNAKADFAPVNVASILDRVANLPIQQWRFKAEDPNVKHVGPMAQDFRAAFGLGEIPTAIATVDADGIALAAIQGLHQIVKEKDAELQELKRSFLELKAQLNELSAQKNSSGQK